MGPLGRGGNLVGPWWGLAQSGFAGEEEIVQPQGWGE